MKAVNGGLHHQEQILLVSIFSLRILLVKTGFRLRDGTWPMRRRWSFSCNGCANSPQYCRTVTEVLLTRDRARA
jgi:hypothetical protein